MNKLLSFLFLLYISSALSQTGDLVTERILYTVRFDHIPTKENGFNDHLDSVKKTKLINQLCDLVYNKKLVADLYQCEQVGCLPDHNVLYDHMLESTFGWSAGMRYVPDPNINRKGADVKRDNRVYRYLINSLSFMEQWYFDKNKNTFTKKVDGVILFEDKYTHNIGMTCNYYLRLNDTTPNEYKPENLIVKNIIYDVPVTHTGRQSSTDDSNWWFNYMEASKREHFFNTLAIKAMYDTILPLPVYRPVYPYDSIINRGKYINSGLGSIYLGRSNWYGSDPLLSGMTDEKIMARSDELSDWTTVKKIRFHEDWYFDPEKFRFEKKVLGIGMIVDKYDDKGKIIGEKCLVYYKFNN